MTGKKENITLAEVIDKVSTWRKYYKGIKILNQDTKEMENHRWTLLAAAGRVNTSKKTLEDYLKILR